jgi:hypothetical protein
MARLTTVSYYHTMHNDHQAVTTEEVVTMSNQLTAGCITFLILHHRLVSFGRQTSGTLLLENLVLACAE